MHLQTLLLSIIPLTSLVQASISCSSSSSCPESAPCCSQYGVCGTGSNCLGGCHPAWSYSLDSCMPMPVCKDVSTRFKSYDDVLVTTEYLGDPDDSDWIYSGYIYTNETEETVLLGMPKESTGTVLSSSRYVWYGKTSATLKTSRGAGVVSSFIYFSNSQDEIDWEYIGYNLSGAEVTYYYEGIADSAHMTKASISNDSFENYHTYEVDWTEESITWSLDGVAVRTLSKSDTYNSSSNTYAYPQTPSRVQFSIWPAGSSSNAEGTIEWAGGEIDWDSQDIQDPGYYYMSLKEASIECYDPPSGTVVNGSNAYIFTDFTDYNQANVAITDDNTILGSSDASGLNPDEGASSSSSSKKSSSASSSSKSSSASSSSEISSTSSSSSSSSASSTSKISSSSSSSKAVSLPPLSKTSTTIVSSLNSSSASHSSSSSSLSSNSSSSSSPISNSSTQQAFTTKSADASDLSSNNGFVQATSTLSSSLTSQSSVSVASSTNIVSSSNHANVATSNSLYCIILSAFSILIL